MLNKGAFVFNIVWGALEWPLKGGSRLIEVAATAGLTVYIYLSVSDQSGYTGSEIIQNRFLYSCFW